MPLYFFHVHDDQDTPDDEGANLPEIGAAFGHAVRSARALMCETLIRDGAVTLHHRIDIEDERNTVLGSVRFKDAIQIVP